MLACSCAAIAGKIGSTSPRPIKEMTQAKAIAHTALGWESSPAFLCSSSRGSVALDFMEYITSLFS